MSAAAGDLLGGGAVGDRVVLPAGGNVVGARVTATGNVGAGVGCPLAGGVTVGKFVKSKKLVPAPSES